MHGVSRIYYFRLSTGRCHQKYPSFHAPLLPPLLPPVLFFVEGAVFLYGIFVFFRITCTSTCRKIEPFDWGGKLPLLLLFSAVLILYQSLEAEQNQVREYIRTAVKYQ